MRSATLRFQSAGPSIGALAVLMVLAILGGPAAAQPAPPPSLSDWSGPHLPGAVKVAPAWLKDAPFDLAEFFAMPPDAENAAALHLDAFFEFGSTVADCFPADRRGRAVATRERAARLASLVQDLDKEEASVPHEGIDRLLSEYQEGFRKLDQAMRRPRCVFAIGLTLDTLLGHAQAAREVVRALRLAVHRSLDRGDFERAGDEIGKILRISRDLRPRGPAISQLVSIGIYRWACSAIEGFLAHPRIQAKHCDGLLRVLAEHHDRALDPFTTGVKAEFVAVRSTLRSFAERVKTTVDPDNRPVEVELERDEGARRLAELLPSAVGRPLEPGEVVDPAILERMATLFDQSAALASNDRRRAFEFTRSVLAADATYAGRRRAIEGAEAALARERPRALLNWIQTDLKFHAISSSRDAVYLGAAECLIAVRRWQLTHEGKTPTDLAAACRATGLSEVPLDPFSGSSLKLAMIAGEPVIYSVGDDGRDDHGLKDADLGRNPGTEGDYLFRFKVGIGKPPG